MQAETWKAVVGWEGLYDVSDQGRVKSLARGRYPNLTDRILKPATVEGYLQVKLQAAPRRAQRKVHQLVLEAFAGPRPPQKEAAHANGMRDDARLGNLSWETHIENERAKTVHGTRFRGEKHPRAKLTASDVIAIRAAYQPGRRSGLAAKYGVHQKVISDIARRKIWKHVQ